MKIKEIVSALERFAPLPLQEGYDNAGLQIGLTEVEATGALLCLDVTEAVIDEAISLGCNFIVSHHPLLFHGCKCISNRDYIGRCIIKAIKKDITIYSAHTNLDIAPGGVSYKMADRLGMKEVSALEPHTSILAQAGLGVVGTLPEPMSEEAFLGLVKRQFDVECVRHNQLTGRAIQKVALCGGAGSDFIQKAIAKEADVYLSGEIGYHDYFGHENDLLLVEIGHYESEQYTKEILYSIIRNLLPESMIHMTKVNTNPINYK